MSSVWVPAPRYVLRKHCVLRLLSGLAPGHLLEVGCAQGDMLRTLAERGFTGFGVDLSEDAIREARTATLAGLQTRMRVGLAGEERGTGPYDYVMGLEVLEHIEDDRGRLSEWRGYLNTGGRLLLSVPAHPERWGASDEAVGHYRRYTRAGLRSLLEQTGFRLEHLWCYGFPMGNLSHLFTERLYRRRAARGQNADRQTRSARSGLDRSALKPVAWIWQNPLFRVFCLAQMLFVHTDWGNGYVLRAQAV